MITGKLEYIHHNACPYKHKYELVEWLVKYRSFTKAGANKLSKKQCYAIWYKPSISDKIYQCKETV